MSTLFCPYCEVEREVRVRKEKEIYSVRGEDISILSRVAVCGHCGEELVDEELESANFERVYTVYRKKHDLLSPADIKTIRERYGLSQRGLSKFLGWGEVTVNRYENGAIQDRAHDTLLRLIADPRNVLELYERSSAALPASAANKLRKKLESLLRKAAETDLESSLSRVLDVSDPNERNGFRRFDLYKMENLILFFARNVNHAFKTKMTKLLWYADFLCFRTTSCSITGSTYLAYKWGPVPDNYQLIFADMHRRQVIDMQEQDFQPRSRGNSVSGERMVAVEEFDPSAFSPEELKCIEYVAKGFRDLTATAMVKCAHAEEAYRGIYRKEAPFERIPYSLADTLSLLLP